MEKVIEENVTIEEIDCEMRSLFKEYCIEYQIEDMRSEKQTVFHGAMQYIYINYIKPTNILKNKPCYVVDNSINKMMTNYNSYNISLLYDLYLRMKLLANAYDKIASVECFKTLTGISKQCISAWKSKEPSSSSLDGDKKAFVEWLLDNDLDQKKEFNTRTVNGVMEQLNNDYDRNKPIQRNYVVTHALTAAELPQLGQKTSSLAVLEHGAGETEQNE